MNHAHLFAFEADFVASLRCVPMAVRLKLDRAEIKLTLRQWNRFTRDDRLNLLTTPCETPAEIAAYRRKLIDLVAARSGEIAKPLADPPAPLWEAPLSVPDAVVAFARQKGLAPPSRHCWAKLEPLQRFVLIKLSRDNHDNINFAPAMQEFGLAEPLTPSRG
ncbi:MAG: nitrate reductase associated protein [Pseudomonadota bacterium]|jgi:hypothetical protein|nr:nitrate reductase associated protein [Caulobacteraceae bacterium]